MRLADYTTEELTRLTTLSERTAKPGEFCSRPTCTTRMRIDHTYEHGKPQVVARDGQLYNALSGTGERRVTSFTDPTELDPPQAEMVKELERRRRPKFVVGDYVVDMQFGWGTMKVVSVWPDGDYRCDSLSNPTLQSGTFAPKSVRPATDAEKRAVVVSNERHGGRTVQTPVGDRFIVLDAHAARQHREAAYYSGPVLCVKLGTGSVWGLPDTVTLLD